MRISDVLSPATDQENVDPNQSSVSILKELNHNYVQLRKQMSILVQTHDQQNKTLNLVLNNQKKMVKAMRAHQVEISSSCLFRFNLSLLFRFQSYYAMKFAIKCRQQQQAQQVL